MKGLTGEHYDILEMLISYDWHVVEMTRAVGRLQTQRPIFARRVRLKELNDLGLIHVRTVIIVAWYNPLSDPPVDGYQKIEVQAILTDQGRDVRDAGR